MEPKHDRERLIKAEIVLGHRVAIQSIVLYRTNFCHDYFMSNSFL